MGDLRDALSRNNRKLPDLAGPSEFFGGDRLLRANDRLAIVMDGVYRRGEAYLRALQRLSALAFGTRTGRALTLYLALPYGGAFVVLEGLQHVVGPLAHLIAKVDVHLLTPVSFFSVGTLALLLIASRDFRTAFGRGLRRSYELAHGVVVGVPTWVLRQAWVRWLLASRAFRFFWRAILVPLTLSMIAWRSGPITSGQARRSRARGWSSWRPASC